MNHSKPAIPAAMLAFEKNVLTMKQKQIVLLLLLDRDVLDGVNGGVEECDHYDQWEQILEPSQQWITVPASSRSRSRAPAIWNEGNISSVAQFAQNAVKSSCSVRISPGKRSETVTLFGSVSRRFPGGRFIVHVRIDETTDHYQHHAGNGGDQNFKQRLHIVTLLDDPVLPERINLSQLEVAIVTRYLQGHRARDEAVVVSTCATVTERFRSHISKSHCTETLRIANHLSALSQQLISSGTGTVLVTLSAVGSGFILVVL
uniref:Uncharacterized protein n=1 Tax=Anopheles culicifacies TaxID=139723 RepID=A0A182MGE5_9DIPT